MSFERPHAPAAIRADFDFVPRQFVNRLWSPLADRRQVATHAEFGCSVDDDTMTSLRLWNRRGECDPVSLERRTDLGVSEDHSPLSTLRCKATQSASAVTL